MALINCPACDKQIFPNAPACLNCGEPINKEPTKTLGSIDPKDPVHIVGLIIALFLAGYVIYLFAEAFK
jgi:hypothetical protein